MLLLALYVKATALSKTVISAPVYLSPQDSLLQIPNSIPSCLHISLTNEYSISQVAIPSVKVIGKFPKFEQTTVISESVGIFGASSISSVGNVAPSSIFITSALQAVNT